MKNIIIIICLLAFMPRGHAQNVGQETFNAICRHMVEQEALVKQRKLMNGAVFLVVDPITGHETVAYQDSGTRAIEAFRALPADRQRKILHADSMYVFPLPDTVCLVDTGLHIYPPRPFLFQGHYFSMASSRRDVPSKAAVLYLDRLILREDSLLFIFAYPEQDYWWWKIEISLKTNGVIRANSSHYDPARPHRG